MVHFQVTCSTNSITLACEDEDEPHVCGRQKCFFIENPVMLPHFGRTSVKGCCVSKYPITPDEWCRPCLGPSIITWLCICKFYLKHIPKDVVTLVGKIILQGTTPRPTAFFELPQTLYMYTPTVLKWIIK